MKKIALTIGQMQRLQELGVDTSKASMYWKAIVEISNGDEIRKNNIKWYLSLDTAMMTCGLMRVKVIPTFNLQDILEELPKYIEVDDKRYELIISSYIGYGKGDCDFIYVRHITDLLQDAYQTLIWIAENGHYKNKNDEKNS